jgi:hypothetical protein
MKEEIKYCVNHKGQKIKPYTSVYESPNKKINWDNILGIAIIVTVFAFFMAATIIMVSQSFV